MQVVNFMKKSAIVVLMTLGVMTFAAPASAMYVWNQHYHTCWDGLCHNYSYHKVCFGGECHTHWSAHNFWR